MHDPKMFVLRTYVRYIVEILSPSFFRRRRPGVGDAGAFHIRAPAVSGSHICRTQLVARAT